MPGRSGRSGVLETVVELKTCENVRKATKSYYIVNKYAVAIQLANS
jgi:hypothetical protein